MKTIYLIHSLGETLASGWYPWLMQELTKVNVEVIALNMPNTAAPDIDEWVTFLDSEVKTLNEDVYFIGHSIGAQAVLRYLEIKPITNIGGLLLVAPWIDLKLNEVGDETRAIVFNWINTPIDFSKVKQFTDNVECLFSDNDPYVPLNQAKIFKEKLGARTTMLHDKGHFSEADGVLHGAYVIDVINDMISKPVSSIAYAS